MSVAIAYAGAIVGYLVHVFQEDGYSFKLYWKNGKLQLGMLWSLVVGVIAVVLAIQSGQIQIATGDPLTVFLSMASVTFGPAFLINTIVSKSSLGNSTNTEENTNEEVDDAEA